MLELVAVAARTPVGLTAESSAAAVRGGISRLREFPFVGWNGDPVVVARDARLASELKGRARLVPMVESVLVELAGKVPLATSPCHVLLALPEARPGFAEVDVAWVVESVRAR